MKTAPVFAALLMLLSSSLARADDLLVYFGTHVGGAGKGFSVSHFDTETGVLSPPKFLLERWCRLISSSILRRSFCMRAIRRIPILRIRKAGE